MVLLLGLIGFLTIGSLTTLVLNAPAVLKAGTGLSPGAIGVIVSAGGLIGAASMLTSGWFSDRAVDRLRDSGVMSAVMAVGFLGLGLTVMAIALAALQIGVRNRVRGGGPKQFSKLVLLPLREKVRRSRLVRGRANSSTFRPAARLKLRDHATPHPTRCTGQLLPQGEKDDLCILPAPPAFFRG